jgi:hypothetical protein
MLSPDKRLPVRERIARERFGQKGGNAIQLEQATEPASGRIAAVVRPLRQSIIELPV